VNRRSLGLAVAGLFASVITGRAMLSQGVDAAALAGRVDPAALPAIAALIDSANAAGLPTAPLADKALEGSAKHADPDRIVGAVRALAHALSAARDALGPEASPDELTAGAGAIRAGIPAATVAKVRDGRASAQPVTIPLAVMSELVARGMTPDNAAQLVLSHTTHGTDDAALVTLARETQASGAPPSLTAAPSAGGGHNAAGFYSNPTSINPAGGGPPTSTTPPPRPRRP
jgi:hypothetical protein